MSRKTGLKVQRLFEQLDSVLRNCDDSSPETLRHMVEIAEATHDYVREQASQMEDNNETIERQEPKIVLLDREKTLVRRQVEKYQLELLDLHQAREDYRKKIKAEKKELAELQSANNQTHEHLLRLRNETAAAYITLQQLQQHQYDVCQRIHKYQAIHDQWQATCEANESNTETRQTHEATLQVVEGPRVPDCITGEASVSSQASGSMQNVVSGSLKVSSSTQGAAIRCLDDSGSTEIDAILESLLESLECSSSTECAAVDSLVVTSSPVGVAVDSLEVSGSVECSAKQSFNVTSSTEIVAVECSEFSRSSGMSLGAVADLYDVDAAVGSCCMDTVNMIDSNVHCMVQLASTAVNKHSKLQQASWSFRSLATKAKNACKKLLVSSSKNMNACDGRRSSSSNGRSRRMSLFDWGSRMSVRDVHGCSNRASLVQ